MKIPMLLLLLLPVASGAQAAGLVNPLLPATTQYSSGYDACLQAEDGTDNGVIQCMQAETSVQDARLNATYKLLRQQLPEDRKQDLRDAQRLWIKYRDAKCDFIPVYRDNRPGSRKAVVDCRLQMTTQRAQELDTLKQVLP